jgi:indolepyruvate decarboxylase
MAALYPRYAAFIRPGDNVVLESGCSSIGTSPMPLADDVQVHAQVLWGSIGWATGATFGIALADRNRRTILITGEGSHQLTANEIGNMGRYGANPLRNCTELRRSAGYRERGGRYGVRHARFKH